MGLPGRLFNVDWMIVLPALYLLGIGMVILSSVANGGNSLVNMSTQITAVVIGLVCGAVVFKTSQSALIRVTPFVYAASMVSLAAVLIAGSAIQGSERWLQLGGVQFQPSEFAKLALILIIARLLALRKDAVNSPMTFVVVLFYAALPAALVALQPDLGTALIIFLVWLAMLSVSRLKTSVLTLMIAGLVLSVFAVTPFLAEYQQARITSFLNPTSDPLGANYNVLQSTIAVGSGGLLGKGLEAGSQSQYNFLPSAHTDFIFAVTAEKLGIIGAVSVLVACMLIVLRSLMIAWSSKTEFGRYVALGVAVIILLQSVVNIGMNIGLLPVTGLPLPLMSYGGTHIIVEMIMLGLLLSVSRNTNKSV